MLEPHAIRDVQFLRALLGRSEEHLADVDPQSLDAEPGGPSAQHLPFAAREVELTLAGLALTDFAEEHQLPLMSASSLRYAEPLVKALEDMEQPFGCDAFGPMALEPTQPGLFWYGIHGVEMMYAALGTGCVRVRAVSHPRQDVVVGEWADGRIGTFRGNREGNASFGMLIHSGKGSAFADVTRSRKPYYAGLLEQVMTMFRSGSPPLDLGETLEIIRFIEAANESRATGRPVVLAGDDQENEA